MAAPPRRQGGVKHHKQDKHLEVGLLGCAALRESDCLECTFSKQANSHGGNAFQRACSSSWNRRAVGGAERWGLLGWANTHPAAVWRVSPFPCLLRMSSNVQKVHRGRAVQSRNSRCNRCHCYPIMLRIAEGSTAHEGAFH